MIRHRSAIPVRCGTGRLGNVAERALHPTMVGRLGRFVLTGLLALCLQAGGCAGTPTSQSPVRVGVVDAQRVLSETNAGRESKDRLNTFMKNRQALMALEEKELKGMEADLLKQASVLSANARREREEQFRRRMMQYQQTAAQLNREVQDKQREVLGAFRQKVEKAVAEIAQELSLVLVVEKGQGGSTIYSHGSIDISDRVIRELNQSGK